MASHDLLGAVNLFEQHDADHHVRPCLLPETEHHVGFVADLIREAHRAADQEGDAAGACVLNFLDGLREIEAAEAIAAFIEHDDEGVFIQLGEDKASALPSAVLFHR